MTNFAIDVNGYVGDGKETVIGYILNIKPAIFDLQLATAVEVAK